MAERKTVVRRRCMWNNMLCTIIEEKGRKLRLRDPYGYPHEGINKRDVDMLDDEDSHATYEYEPPA